MTDEDSLNQWNFTDVPFLNELCVTLLVALRHQVERELVSLKALADEGGKEITGQQYKQKVRDVREKMRKRNGWKNIKATLKLESCNGYKPMEALRCLANSYKHNPWKGPDEELLDLLKLRNVAYYAPLPESPAVQEGLAALIGIAKDADYCDIAERFVDIANAFLAAVRAQTKLGKVKWGPILLRPAL